MVKHLQKVLFTATMLLIVQSCWAYDFSAVYNSTTFYYNITSNTAPYTVSVVWPNDTATTIWGTYAGYTKPSGAITIPSTVTNNGITYTVTEISTAFAVCDSLTSVTIPNTVTSIGLNAFRECTHLTSLTIPDSVRYIGVCAFYGCTGLTSVTIGNSVTNIGNEAFYGCASLTSVTIPTSVIYIGFQTFANCTGLTCTNYTGTIARWCNINFGEGGNPILQSCNLYINSQLVTNLVIPNNVNTIKQYAFYGDTCITSVTIGNSVTSIGNFAFSDCTGLTSVTIGNSVASIGRQAFSGCTGLTSVTIGNSVTSIGEDAFYDCTGLTSVTIPNSVTNIGNFAFSGCTGLTSVTIPNSVTNIGNSAFSGCTGLTSVTFRRANTTIGAYAFLGVTTTIPIYIPCNSLGWYVNKMPNFNNFVETVPYEHTVSSQDTAKGTVATIIAPTCNTPSWTISATANTGYTFSRWSDGNTQNPRSITVTQDTILIAFFTSNQGIAEVEDAAIRIYPNPASDKVTLEGVGNGADIFIINAMGKVVRRLENAGSAITFSVGDLPKGIYFVRVGNAVRKLAVE